MKKTLLSLVVVLAAFALNAQNISLEIPIRTTGGTATDTLDDGTVVTFELSTDDVEQENDEVDSMYDDDLDAGWEGAPDDQNTLTTGLRFTNVQIPAGATIDSAFVCVSSHEAKTALDVAELTITGEATDDAVTFDEANFNDTYLLTDRPKTSASVEWMVDVEWKLWEDYHTPDLKDIIQEIVDRQGWEYGNAIALFMQGENQGPSDYENAREFESFENIADPEDIDENGNPGDGQNHPERVPMLKVYYSLSTSMLSVPIRTTGGTATDTLDNGSVVTFELSTDDAEQENDEVDSMYDDDLDAGWEGAPDDQNTLTTGLRFTEINVPAGATIDSAFIKVCSHEAKTALDVAELTITGEATDNAVTFDEANFNDIYLLTDRPKTSASVEWTVGVEWKLWEDYHTPDLKDIIQEIVDRQGWEYGNAIALFMQGENQGPSDYENAREFESFENIADPEDIDENGNPGDGQNHPERAPQLVIYYSTRSDVVRVERETVHFNVYPNPANNYINIETASKGNIGFKIFDLTGKVVKVVDSNKNNTITVDVSNLENGVYLLQGTQNQNASYKRIIIQ